MHMGRLFQQPSCSKVCNVFDLVFRWGPSTWVLEDKISPYTYTLALTHSLIQSLTYTHSLLHTYSLHTHSHHTHSIAHILPPSHPPTRAYMHVKHTSFQKSRKPDPRAGDKDYRRSWSTMAKACPPQKTGQLWEDSCDATQAPWGQAESARARRIRYGNGAPDC